MALPTNKLGIPVLKENDRIRELTTMRSSVKGQITKFKNYLSTIQDKTELSKVELAELSLKLSKFESLSVKYDDLQNQIEILSPESLSQEVDERERIEHEIIVNIATAKTVIDSYNKIESDEQRRGSILEAQSFLDQQMDMGFKLPQIQISKFDGSYFRWLEFRDTFQNLIHNNNRIKQIHKFHYLISYLEGDAARIISNLEVSSANYAEAWKLLGERYDNKRLLINHHISALFNIHPSIRESERSLRFLVDHVTKNLRALASLDQPTDKWDILLIYMLTSKLDSRTLTKWEEFRNTLDDVPTLDQFYKFLIDRADVLEALSRNKFENNSSKFVPTTSRPAPAVQSHTNNYNNHYNNNRNERSSHTKSFASVNHSSKNKQPMYQCIICNENHKIYDCPTFKAKSISDRMIEVNKYKLCANCLRQGHPTDDCRMGPCRECKKRHNSLLHEPSTVNNAGIVAQAASMAHFSGQNNEVLLSTALIEVTNPNTKEKKKVRALLDCGSQSSFISRSLKNKLSLNSIPIDTLKVIGIGNNCSNEIDESCIAQVNSLNCNFNATLSCFVLDELTSEIPKAPINVQNLNIPTNIKLADPDFHQPASIDMLIGADIFWDILGNEQHSLGPNNPKLRNTKLGWVISGPICTKNQGKTDRTIHCKTAVISNTPQNEVDKMLTKFWELEELPNKINSNENDNICEKHFLSHTVRLPTGQFCVELPLRDSPDKLGDTFYLAKKRFLNLERKFKRNPILKSEYTKFIREYAELGHLSEAAVAKPDPCYFLCHHAVLREQSESTSLRVVFDGSAPSSTGTSLNDILMVGPNVQDSLFSILIRARQYKYLLAGDIEKMYRMVLVNEKDRDLQLILWREDESQPIRTLRLNTLTYGTASASYLSTRCLSQLGEEQGDELIKTIIQKDFYVDDLITGSNSEDELRHIQKSVSEALSAGCFNLRKYKSNLPSLFQNSNINTQENLKISESSSTLGMGWSPSTDNLHFPVKYPNTCEKITKRFIMSNSFKIFDPLGLLSPCIIQPKMMLQKLWQQEIDWDQPVSQDIVKEWEKFVKNLPFIEDLQIKRPVICDSPKLVEIHSFSDASQVAYGACIYVRSVDENNKVVVNLLTSKSKVTPIKPTTMPRLELCAALLAARLCKAVTTSLRYEPDRIVHWCDSTIVLGWLKNDYSKLKTFVANRVGEILEMTDLESWRYVPTADNPADYISRGVDASKLVSLKSWWSGPRFLLEEEHQWPILKITISDLPEVKSNICCTTDPVIDFEKFSLLNKLKKSFAYVKRFIFNLRNPKCKRVGKLTLDELNESFHDLCIMAQKQIFPKEYSTLLENKSLSSKCKLLILSPFMEQKLIRVGGRINAADCTYERKHPILLHSSHHLTKLIFQHEHIKNMHAAPQLLLASVRETVWPVKGRHLARSTVNKCVRCRRARGKTLCPKMGSLPSQRVNPDYPFKSVGLDFAGPFNILNRKGRGSKLIKCYLCLFVCMRYKCIHLEAVTDLSKDAFIMTLRRFISRRGRPAEIFCDNGRNFVAAAKEINQFLKSNVESLSGFADNEQIRFLFTPCYAPHFGGIWESGVKSAKHHIKRVMGNSHLTFEEISTLFAQVEAILNSRPLYPLSSSPNDLLSLTPGHFLIGRPLTAIPSPSLEECRESSLRRYQRLEKINQHFWQRWQKEYISELQQRTKWRTNTAKLNVGDLVIIHEDHVPPLCWRLGRVCRLFPGPDGISRVADINTTKGCVRRPLVRLCPLPTAEDFNC